MIPGVFDENADHAIAVWSSPNSTIRPGPLARSSRVTRARGAHPRWATGSRCRAASDTRRGIGRPRHARSS
eukprot:COSAG02_NODE_3820_length_6190_cov_1.860121_3_plen_71_part_00